MPIHHLFSITVLCALAVALCVIFSVTSRAASQDQYPLHRNITATLFWIGEDATSENAYISNVPSCWDEQWVKHYGGIDAPNKRNGFVPSAFVPKENPFYIALPYNDFAGSSRVANAKQVIPWAGSKQWGRRESMCKNQWVRIIKDNKVAYAQWEDSGPFVYDDAKYVFGTALPRNDENQSAGIDLSPAIHDYLGLQDIDHVDWQFVPESSVPDGPWKTIITRSQITWN